MSPEAVTIVVPIRNAASYIDACLDSVAAQTLPSWRCIVVDDGSTDDSGDRVARRQDPRIELVSQPNSGVSKARNAGLRRAETSYIMFLDGDDVLHPLALERLVAGLRSVKDAVASFGSFKKILEDGSPYPGAKPLRQVEYPSGDVLKAMLRQNFLANGGHVLIRTEAAKKIGGFDAKLRLSEDWEFWCRLALQGPFFYIGGEPECLYFRVSPQSASGGLSKDWLNHQAAISAVLTNPQIAARFSATLWRQLCGDVLAAHLWEAARVNFTLKRFSASRRMMLSTLRQRPTWKRLLIFCLAELSRCANRPILSRYRFRDLDVRPPELVSAKTGPSS